MKTSEAALLSLAAAACLLFGAVSSGPCEYFVDRYGYKYKTDQFTTWPDFQFQATLNGKEMGVALAICKQEETYDRCTNDSKTGAASICVWPKGNPWARMTIGTTSWIGESWLDNGLGFIMVAGRADIDSKGECAGGGGDEGLRVNSKLYVTCNANMSGNFNDQDHPTFMGMEEDCSYAWSWSSSYGCGSHVRNKAAYVDLTTDVPDEDDRVGKVFYLVVGLVAGAFVMGILTMVFTVYRRRGPAGAGGGGGGANATRTHGNRTYTAIPSAGQRSGSGDSEGSLRDGVSRRKSPVIDVLGGIQ